MTAPVLIFGWGNPSRGDDALGPLFIERIDAMNLPGVDCLTDFQLQVEHVLDLQGRERVLFVDASLTVGEPYSVIRLEARRDASFTSHAMTPQAVLQAFRDLEKREPPPAWLLSIRGEQFELGAPLSPTANCHLEQSLVWALEWIPER
ncbi:MAG: hydrogenase maturation protease [Rhodocyclaceae bacterium]|nr:hydrogenase maturation protease [Rhodocyclaceae bacterium]